MFSTLPLKKWYVTSNTPYHCWQSFHKKTKTSLVTFSHFSLLFAALGSESQDFSLFGVGSLRLYWILEMIYFIGGDESTNQGWADAMARILEKDLPENKVQWTLYYERFVLIKWKYT